MYVWLECGLYQTVLFLTKADSCWNNVLAVILLTNTNRILPPLRMISGEHPLWHGIPTISPTYLSQCIAKGKVQISKDSWCKDSSYRLEGLLIAFGGKGVQTNWSKCSKNICVYAKKKWDLGKRKGCERTKYIKTWIICQDHTWFYVNTTAICRKETLLQCADLTLSMGTLQHVLCLRLFRRSSWSKSSWATRKWWERWDCRQPLEW